MCGVVGDMCGLAVGVFSGTPFSTALHYAMLIA